MGFNVNYKALGLSSSVNELESPEGALSVADNVLVTKDDVIESRPGFEACQTGLPTAKPLQMFTGKSRLFVHVGDNIYYKGLLSCEHKPMPTSTATIMAPSNFMSYFASLNEIYISQITSNNIRKLSIGTRYLSSIAGIYNTSGYLDGASLSAKFSGATGIYRTGTDVYIADTGNYVLRKLDTATNTVSTVAGVAGASGSTDGIGAAARLDNPGAMVGDGTYIYFFDILNYVIRKYEIATANVTTVAGVAGASGSTDGIGAAARFTGLNKSMCIYGTNIYIGDLYAIRHMDTTTLQVTTLAGSINVSGDTDANGTASRLNYPTGMACDANYVYFNDYSNNKIKKMLRTPPYTVSTIVGDGTFSTSDGVGAAAKIASPDGMVIVGNTLYVTSYFGLLRTVNLSTLKVTSLTYPPTDGLTANVDGYVSGTFVGPD